MRAARSAVVDALAVIVPCVLVGVEMDERELAVACRMPLSSGQVTKWSPPRLKR